MASNIPPPNEDELVKYIQYRLSALVEENAHHRFEELCFRIAKATVATNLLPPTGPVSAGGDQGRDFESYRVPESGGSTTAIFASCIKASSTLVFGCTTQRGEFADLAAKVKGDIDTACRRSPKPTSIYYYIASCTLPPAKRHILQDWALMTHSVHLEVQDQRTIAEALGERPNRWLAQHYLQVPGEMLRPSTPEPEVPNWYREARDRFSDPTRRRLETHGEVALVVRCARHAWEDLTSIEDDGLWLDILSDMWGAPGGRETEAGLRAFYEMFVYLLRGRRRCGLEDHIPTYVDAVLRFDHIGLSHDIQCFASYLITGVKQRIISMPFAAAKEQFDKLLAWIEMNIDTAPGPVIQSDLLIARGSLVGPSFATENGEPTRIPVERIATETLTWWTRAIDVGEPLNSFPILLLREMVNRLTPVLCESAEFDDFVSRLDKVSESRVTGDALAATTRDRAMALFNAGKPLEALTPMLAARRYWHNGDRIRGSLLSSIFTVECMRQLGLLWAAKRTLYDMISVCNRVGAKEHGDILTASVFSLAEVEYLLGDWATAMHSYSFALVLQGHFAPDPWNWEKHKRLQDSIFYLVNMIIAGEIAAPGFRAWALKVVSAWELDNELARLGDTVTKNWHLQGIVGGPVPEGCPFFEPPLADTLPTRLARWAALGCRWMFRWKNEYSTESVAMELLATVQVLLAGLAKRYRHLIPCEVRVEIRLWEAGKAPIEQIMGEPGASFIVRLPVADDTSDSTMDLRTVTLFVATQVVGAVSVDKDVDDFLPKLTGTLLRDAIFVGASPAEGREQAFPRDHWDRIRAAPMPQGKRMSIPLRECQGLPWMDGESPLYDREEAAAKNRLRHERGFTSAAPVLHAHSSNPKFRLFVDELRREGWLDWQIMSALAPASVSVAENAMRKSRLNAQDIERVIDAGMKSARSGNYAAPAWSAEFERAIRDSLSCSLISALQVWGLGIYHPVPDLKALRRFLSERFHHFADHTPVAERARFPWDALPNAPPASSDDHGATPKTE